MEYTEKCAICKKTKSDVYWCFAGRIGCKDCADSYWRQTVNNVRAIR